MSDTKKRPGELEFEKAAKEFFESASEFVSFDEDGKMSSDVVEIPEKKSGQD